MQVKMRHLLHLRVFSISAALLILFYSRNKFESFVLPLKKKRGGKRKLNIRNTIVNFFYVEQGKRKEKYYGSKHPIPGRQYLILANT